MEALKQNCKRTIAHMRVILFFLFIVGGVSFVCAQNSSISGVVLDDEHNEPVIGAVVAIEGTQTAIMTDVDGKYTLPKLSAGSYTLVATYVGYEKVTQKVTLADNENKVVDFMMKSNTTLTEVVVTALGIKRDEKALGYSVSNLSSDELTNAMPSNWSDALSGKIAGVNMTRAGGPGGDTKIVLRGENSLDGNSEALIIVDGVILSGSSGRRTNVGNSSYNTNGETTVSFGSSLSDINPDDIENVSVLKGPGAAALYGARGANGAIIITTKQGIKQPGIGVSINSNFSFQSVSHWPDYQYEYGQGDGGANWYSYNQSIDGASTRSTSSAWGPKFNEKVMFYQYDPVTQTKNAVRTPWVPYKNNRKDFFETGLTATNSVAIQGGNKDVTARFSYTNQYTDWILPNTGYSRNSIALAVSYKASDNLKLESKINYTNKTSDNLPTSGYGRSSPMYFVRGLVPNADINWFKDYWKIGEEELAINRPFSSLIDNPYAVLHEMTNAQTRNQVSGNVSATYNFTKDLSLMVRATLDFSMDNREQKRPYDTQYFRKGMYRYQNVYNQEYTYEFLAQYKYEIGKFNLNASLGGLRMGNRYSKDEMRADNLLYPGVYTMANSEQIPTSHPWKERRSENAIYGLLAFNYDFMYLDITGRNDWFSTLASPISTKNASVFYPSFNLSGVITEAVQLPKQISFLKVRGSWSKVGSGGSTPYRTSYTYSSQSSSGFNAGLANPTVLPNPDLKPLKTISYEVGIDLRMFDSRLKLDAATYINNTSDQIIRANLDRSSGYSAVIMNAGEVQNKGLEIQLDGKIIDQPKDGFKLSAFLTYSMNRNKLKELTPELTVYNIYNSARGSLNAYPGGSLGAMYGLGYKRAPEGSVIHNSDGSTTDVSGQIVYDQNGYALMSDSSIYIGDTQPKWKGSLGINMNYKNFGLSILFDGQFGGIGYSLTHAVLAEEGKLKKTLPGRYSGIVGDGVVQNADGSWSKNTTLVTDIPTYYKSHFDRSNVEANTFKTDYIKLREVRLDYTVPKDFLKRLKIQNLVLGLYARDLFTISNWPAFDPEIGDLTGTDIVAGFEVAQFPSTRTIGFNLKLGF